MIGIGISLSQLLLASDTTAPPQTGGGEVLYYPQVAAVDLSAAGGSLGFPEANNAAAAALPGLESYKGVLSQSMTGVTFLGSSVTQATFAIVRFPRDKRLVNTTFSILGNNGTGGMKWRLRYNGASQTLNPNRFQFYQSGNGGSALTLHSAPWTEDEALVVAWADGAHNWRVDWYSLKDGTLYPGNSLPTTVNGFNPAGTIYNIGGSGSLTAFVDNGNFSGLWPGSIEMVGHAAGAGTPISTAQWQRLALGADPRSLVPVANMKLFRRFDGTAGSLARDPYWTADTTAPSQPVGSTTAGVPGSTLLPGSTFRRQSETQYLLMTEIGGGQVYGLTAEQTERAVPFSGVAAGFAGPVEIRVFEAETGVVVRDWTEVATPSGGSWSGTLMLPESSNGWLYAQARARTVPSLIAHRREPFGVGYKVMFIGQSQTSIGMTGGNSNMAMVGPMSASYVRLDVMGTRSSLGANARWPIMARVGMRYNADGLVSFMNQFRAWKPKTPVMFYDEAVNGTSMRTLLEGNIGSSDRQWADSSDKFARYGNDVTVVLWNWLMNEGATSGADVFPLMTAMFLPAGVGQMAKSLVPELAPGWRLGILGGDRESGINGREGMRAERIRFAQDYGFGLGPTVSDYRIENSGGPHPVTQTTAAGQTGFGANLLNGPARFGQRMAVTAGRALGFDNSQNPYYANARLSTDQRKILVDVVAVNGGMIFSPAPGLLRSWLVKEPADTNYVTTLAKGASAVLNGTTVEITHPSGTWSAGTQVMRMDDGEKRAAGDGAAEDAIHAGGIYESWPLDPLGFGFPVIGQRNGDNRWSAQFEALLP